MTSWRRGGAPALGGDLRRAFADAIGFDRAQRRDGLAVCLGLVLIAAAAWSGLVLASHLMGAMRPAIPGPRMIGAGRVSWTPADWALACVMWVAMMVAMMLPTAGPVVVAYARVDRRAPIQAGSLAATARFATGYLLVWTGVALAAAVLQWWLEQAGWLDPMTGRGAGVLDGFLLSGAGLYQLTPLKDRCLRHCQSPFGLVQSQGGEARDGGGDLGRGLRHGAYCVGCCWCLMLLLFAGGVMDLRWAAAISAFILIEKITPSERLVSRLAALGLVAAGMTLLFVALPAMGGTR